MARQITSNANRSNFIQQVPKLESTTFDDRPQVASRQNNNINPKNVGDNTCKKRDVSSDLPVSGHIADTVKRRHGTQMSSKNLKLPPGTAGKPGVNENREMLEGLSKLDIHGRK